MSQKSRPSRPTPTPPTRRQWTRNKTMTTPRWRPRCARRWKGASGVTTHSFMIHKGPRSYSKEYVQVCFFVFLRVTSWILPVALPQLLANHQLQSRPNLIHRADFDINIAHRQRDIANDIFGDIGWHL